MITDPTFYLFAIPAVILVGISKGGFGGSIAILGVPLMALAISPIRAAGIMLPILIVMDLIAVASYRRTFDVTVLAMTLPGALVGVGLGYLLAAYVDEAMVRLIIGSVAVLFSLDHWGRKYLRRQPDGPRGHSPVKGTLWGLVAGFTSFVSHAGGPPYQMYTLPLGLEKRVFAGTGVYFFFTLNAAKLVPYFALGQFSGRNLATSATLLPVAVLATLFGVWLVRIVPQQLFFRVIYVFVFVIGLKLMWDGIAGLV
ncbi:sulfite exporter TauE/SafE family protein [Amorphus orientalis]|uniref:Probable membrane transporter protein n=1 Tax=Amorphus orientalis TaxID=649198 RepID=A0AAE3VKQ5_9HYPH|nr:sulfite exporter TauE/SafE family protein [Amorphus orientalis]MDQ0314244.1 putative membrane protein YfcA [Amorphus orientalis]